VTSTASETTRLRLGRPVRCRDGKVGRLADVGSPHGSAELRRTSSIVSVDGRGLGRVEGFLVTGSRVTDVVLESDLPRRTGTVAIPIASVEAIETDRITVSASEEVIHSLPGLRSHRFPFFA
jgi:hypothetical protein